MYKELNLGKELCVPSDIDIFGRSKYVADCVSMTKHWQWRS